MSSNEGAADNGAESSSNQEESSREPPIDDSGESVKVDESVPGATDSVQAVPRSDQEHQFKMKRLELDGLNEKNKTDFTIAVIKGVFSWPMAILFIAVLCRGPVVNIAELCSGALFSSSVSEQSHEAEFQVDTEFWQELPDGAVGLLFSTYGALEGHSYYKVERQQTIIAPSSWEDGIIDRLKELGYLEFEQMPSALDRLRQDLRLDPHDTVGKPSWKADSPRHYVAVRVIQPAEQELLESWRYRLTDKGNSLMLAFCDEFSQFVENER